MYAPWISWYSVQGLPGCCPVSANVCYLGLRTVLSVCTCKLICGVNLPLCCLATNALSCFIRYAFCSFWLYQLLKGSEKEHSFPKTCLTDQSPTFLENIQGKRICCISGCILNFHCSINLLPFSWKKASFICSVMLFTLQGCGQSPHVTFWKFYSIVI